VTLVSPAVRIGSVGNIPTSDGRTTIPDATKKSPPWTYHLGHRPKTVATISKNRLTCHVKTMALPSDTSFGSVST
jgi:hypothetical protein